MGAMLLFAAMNALSAGADSETAPAPTPAEIVVVIGTPGPVMEETPSPEPTPAPTPTPEPTPTPTPAPRGLLGWEYEELFSPDAPVLTETEYKGKDVSISISKVSERTNKYTGKMLCYYVADIYLQDVTLFRRAYSKENGFKTGKAVMAKALAKEAGALLAISGDYCNVKSKGVTIANGELLADNKKYERDIGVLYKDGTFRTFPPEEIDAEQLMRDGAWQCWNFGPSLLDENGFAKTSFTCVKNTEPMNPRALLGYYGPGHYCFVLVDGRQNGYSSGLDMASLAKTMEDLGCKVAYNLDGGISAQLVFDGHLVNSPSEKRSIVDIAYIAAE